MELGSSCVELGLEVAFENFFLRISLKTSAGDMSFLRSGDDTLVLIGVPPERGSMNFSETNLHPLH